MRVIGLSGRAGSGKNTVGSFIALHLTAKYNLRVQMSSLAAPLKKMALDMGWDGQKNEAGRFFLQKIGETYRELNPNYWINLLWEDIEIAERYKPTEEPKLYTGLGEERGTVAYIPRIDRWKDVFIVTDVRYWNEAEWLTNTLCTEGHQTALWRVSKEGCAGLVGDAGKHASETELDTWDFNGYMSAAPGDFKYLYLQARDLVDGFMGA